MSQIKFSRHKCQLQLPFFWDYVFDKLLGGRDAALRRPRPAGRNERKKRPLFRRLTLRSATGTAQRAVPTLKVCE
jgi:hypothetical protein